ncbi:hypothetical protein [Longimicrobium terrae]|uniref:Uncharacterized protein n=1 Tax=Longimicrobium terrae TaxID=1639882 RepID=A0A841H125_9BACT|nr:hypothetical protein [Longimicrobium terrae]MBB4637397.1 hypothetical protein [Longimicrobium terrae]MBB6071795.1 hypothetical protein [Longimicrobium terrae]NNC28555.1 hypothetical protein [Longimicrobium terrae]
MKRLLCSLVPALAVMAACNGDSSGVVVERPRTAEALLAQRPWRLTSAGYRNAVQSSFSGLQVAGGAPVNESQGLALLAAHAAADSLMNPGPQSRLLDSVRAFHRFRTTDPSIGQVGDSTRYVGLRVALVGALTYAGAEQLERSVLTDSMPNGALRLAGIIFSSALPESVPADMVVLTNGRLLLRVNARLINENPLRLIPTIAHELAAHQDGQNSVGEEVAGNVLEQMIWYRMLEARPELAAGETMLPVMRNLRLGAFLQSGTGASLGVQAANGSLFPDVGDGHPLGATRSFTAFVQTQYPAASASSSTPANNSLLSFLARLGVQCPATVFSASTLACLDSELGRISAGQLNGFRYDRRVAVMGLIRMANGSGGDGGTNPQ